MLGFIFGGKNKKIFFTHKSIKTGTAIRHVIFSGCQRKNMVFADEFKNSFVDRIHDRTSGKSLHLTEFMIYTFYGGKFGMGATLNNFTVLKDNNLVGKLNS